MIRDLRELEDELSADLPIHLDIIAIILGIGLTARSMSHIIAALLADVDPALDNHDLTVLSPVVSIRDHASTDLSARLISVSVGLVGIWMFINLAAPIGSDFISLGVVAFAMVNAAVCLFDPILFLVSRRTDRY